MRKCYVIRFFIDDASALNNLPEEEHSPHMNFPGEVFALLVQIQQAIMKIMCAQRESQGTSGSCTLHLTGNSTWEWLKREFQNGGVSTFALKNTRKKTFVTRGLGYCSVRVKNSTEITRIQCIVDLQVARDIFGNSIFSGVRVRAPNVPKRHSQVKIRRLQMFDNLNVFDLPEISPADCGFCTTNNGLDFKFDNELNRLIVCARYKKINISNRNISQQYIDFDRDV